MAEPVPVSARFDAEPVPNRLNEHRVVVFLPTTLLEWLTIRARERGCSRSTYVRWLLADAHRAELPLSERLE